jgi:DNA-binding SARP family transcriptional activator
MEFRVLGPFEVRDGDREISIGAFRQRAVLALLTIHAGQTLSTDRIIDEIWAGSPPPSALKTLHAYISRLRRVLHSPPGGDDGAPLLSRHPGYVLAIDPSQVDSFRFEQLVADAGVALNEGNAEVAADLVRQALSLWRGTALAEFAYEPFATNESQRLMERRMEAVELRIDTDLALARHASVVSELEALVSEHPVRERLWAQLMIALYRCGRQADALAAYTKVRRLLVDELGIEPGPELRNLERLVLEQSPELAWQPTHREGHSLTEPSAGSTLESGATRTARGRAFGEGVELREAATELLPLVGRDTQLDQLAEVVHSAPPGTFPRLVLVLGEAGCGKTRLLTEFGRRATEQGVLVAFGSAEEGSSLPYGPFGEAVRSVIRATGQMSIERVGHLKDDLTRLLPEIGPPPPLPEDLGTARARLFEAVLQLLSGAGDDEELLLMIDDAQHMGEGAVALLRALLDRTWSRPVIVVLASRVDVAKRGSRLDERFVELLRREGAQTIEVGRLSADDLTTLVEQLEPGDTEESEQIAAHLAGLTAGIPLLVREVLASGPSAVPQPSVVHLQRRSATPLVEGVIGLRLSKVSEPTQDLLESASMIGAQFDLGVLAEVAGQPATTVVGLLDEAIGAGILVESDEPDRLAFDHGLIREVVASSVTASRQTRIHGLVAEVLAGHGESIEAAQHALLGYVGITAETATQLAIDGADAAMASLSFEVARSLCLDALAGPAANLDAGARADLLLRLGRAESLSGHVQEAETAWRSAAELARSVGDHDRLAHIALGTDPHGHTVSASSELRWSLLTEALAELGPGWTPLRLLVASEWLTEAVMPPRRDFEEDFVTEVVGAATRFDDPAVLAAAYQARHILARTRNFQKRREFSEEFRSLAEQLGDDRWLFEAHLACLIDAAVYADGRGLAESLDALRQTCARYRAPRALWTFELAAASCARLRGEFEIANEHESAASSIGDRYAIMDNAVAIAATAFLDAFHLGQLPALRPLTEQFAAAPPEAAAWTLAAGITAAADGDAAVARSALEKGVGQLPTSPEVLWLTSVCLASELVAWVGTDERLASELTSLLEPYAGNFAVLGTLSSDFGPVDRCLGILRANVGDLAGAREHFALAIDASQRLGARPWELRARTDWLIAEVALGQGAPSWSEDLEAELAATGLGGALGRLRAASESSG